MFKSFERFGCFYSFLHNIPAEGTKALSKEVDIMKLNKAANKNIIKAGLACAMILLFVSNSLALAVQTESDVIDVNQSQRDGVKQIVINPIDLKPGQVITPFGTILNKSQVYEVKSGEFIDMVNISRNVTGRPIKLPTYNDWIEDAYYYWGSGITDYSGYWTVPSSPTSTGSLIYLFIGLEPSNGANILQPVLQWGNNGNFGGNYWTLASWYATSNSGVYSTPINVDVGDTIYGRIYRPSPSNPTSWVVNSIDVTKSTTTTLPTTASSTYTYSYVALEGYNINTCSQFPGDTSFTNLYLYGVTPSWTKEQLQTGCGLSVDIISSSKVNLNT